MSTLPSQNGPTNKHRPKQPPGGAELGQGVSREARQVAAMVLEVLAGSRTTGDAAGVLGVSMTRYYVLETRALQGLLAACEPRTQGRQRSLTADLQALRRECERLKREVLRQQALLRAAQRTVGLTPPAAPTPKGSSKKRQRRPVARALTVANHLQSADNELSVLPASTPEGSQPTTPVED
jgi:hypothetical protein